MLTWLGEELEKKIGIAEERAVNKTMGDCVRGAKLRAPVRMGKLRDDIQILRAAARVGKGHRGYWGVRGGSRGGWYVWIVHTGSRAHIAHGPHPGFRGRPFLRQTVDVYYPRLPKQVKAELQLL